VSCSNYSARRTSQARILRAGHGWFSGANLLVFQLLLQPGFFEQHSRLKIVIGHGGEGVVRSLKRFDQTGLYRSSVLQTFSRQFWVSTSGSFPAPSFLETLDVLGPKRILLGVDDPFTDNEKSRAFLESLDVTASEREMMAFRNAQTLLKL
jgi:predicted TIM-barrel fold metal-dependent hydrolase